MKAFKLELQYAAMKREQQQQCAKMEEEEAKKTMSEGNCTNAAAGKDTQTSSHKQNVEQVSDQVKSYICDVINSIFFNT